MVRNNNNNNNFSKLYAEMIHREKHAGVDSDMAKIRLEFWVVNLRKICNEINFKCIDCRRRRGNYHHKSWVNCQ